MLAQLGIDAEASLLRAYSQAMESWFRRPGVIRPYPEVHHVLRALEGGGYRLGIVSNWSWDLRERVDHVGLTGYFEVIWGSAYAGCNKPHPGIFRQALNRLPGPQPPACRMVYVGDSYRHDVVGARNAGLDAVLVDREGNADEADCPVIDDLNGLLAVLGAS
jgi:putative hydrolase of the HAD superfamily